MITVILADDHPVVRDGLCFLLNSQSDIKVVGTAANGHEAVQLATKLNPDVAVMDIAMPLLNGSEATQQITSTCPHTRAHLDEAAEPSGPHPRAPTVAVLPFASLSADKDNEYFSDGLADEVITLLTRIPRLRVTARTSSFAFRDRCQDVREIGARLGVSALLEGSVQRAGGRFRVSAQLVETRSGFHLWSDSYDREAADVFAVQDEIAHAIAGAPRGATGAFARR